MFHYPELDRAFPTRQETVEKRQKPVFQTRIDLWKDIVARRFGAAFFPSAKARIPHERPNSADRFPDFGAHSPQKAPARPDLGFAGKPRMRHPARAIFHGPSVMQTSLRQTDRTGRLITVLKEDTLVLLRFEGTDRLNDLFDYRVEALAADDTIDFDDLLGTHATVEIRTGAQERTFDGVVTRTRWLGEGENGHRYELTLRPWLWIAGLRRNQRIFHDRTVTDIIQRVLAEYGADQSSLSVSVMRNYPVLEYTVQYGETDLNFVRRQMERHGISFHFEHGFRKHKLILTDEATSHRSIGERPYLNYDGHHQAETEHFWSWSTERNMTTGAIRLTDYDFERPKQSMVAQSRGKARYNFGKEESFDYPGDYLDNSAGAPLARMRLQREGGQDQRVQAAGDVASLGAGLRVKLGGDRVPGTGESYLCLSAHHRFNAQSYGTGVAQSDETAYEAAFVLMPETAPMAPPLRTPVPKIYGPQTAVVEGSGEIDCDKYGRILVKFHWDLDGAISMRCRVSQTWAGARWGGMVIPRIGMEVVVEFLEGDPDKPLVTGCVYNGANMPPYPLPDKKTVSTFKTDSHQGDGYNELRFEDAGGSEEIFLHAQKDHNTVIENDESHTIGHDRTKSVGHDQSETIGHDKTKTVGNDQSESIGNNKSITVAKDQSETIGGNLTEAVSKDKSVDIGQSASETVGKSKAITVGKELVIKVGEAKIVMKSDGTIEISGKKISLNASSTVSVKASGDITVKGSKINQN